MIYNYRTWALIVAITFVALLPACEKQSTKGSMGWDETHTLPKNSNGAIKARIAAKAEADLTDKAIENYIDAEDRIATMISVSGPLEQMLKHYKEQGLSSDHSSADSDYSTKFLLLSMTNAVKHLQKGAAIHLTGPYAELDQAGKDLATKADRFTKTLAQMDHYLKSEAYREDNFAKAKKLDPIFIEQASAFIDAYQKFSKVSAAVETYQNDAFVSKLKKAGELRKAYGYEAYGYAQRFLNLATTDNPNDPKVAESIDKHISSMNQTLMALRKENDKIQDIKSPKFGTAEEQLSSLLAIMQEAKKRGFEEWTMKRFVRQYNQFVKEVLDIGVLG